MKQAFLLILILIFTTSIISQTSVSKEVKLMGVSFTFTAVHKNEDVASKAILDAINEVSRIEKLISSWDPNSQTSRINSNAGIQPTKVDKELFDLINRSIRISQMTNGYFDISFASIDKIWDFSNTNPKEIPSEYEISKSIQKIGYQDIELDYEHQLVFLRKKGMKIGFGAIGKGYAANKAKEVMKGFGIESGVVNAGGDLLAWGSKPDNSDWQVGIANPENKYEVIAWIGVKDQAVVTSGSYEKFIEIKNVKYCHIINPKTGWPVKKLSSVTVFSSDAEFADAMATSIFVIGVVDGLKLVNHLQGIDCLIIDEKGKMHFSNNLDKTYFIEK